MSNLNDNAALNEMLLDIDSIEKRSTYANWSDVAGNTVEITWADGTLGRVVTQVVYKQGATTLLTKTFTYNANDEVISITAS